MESSLEIIGKQTEELAEQLLNMEVDDKYIALLDRYNSYLSQFVQVVSNVSEDERADSEVINRIIEIHKRLEAKLDNDKLGIKNLIIKVNSDMSIKRKYYGINSSSFGLNRKG